MRKLVASTVVLAILTSPAFAQKEEPLVTIERDKQQQAEALDKQYKKLMERSRKEPETPRADPWATMRAPNDAKR
ncbi:MAG TPA: hypothetical protein VKE53_04025 [Pseudolabrys sp.]|jgi:low affinity Fe/Cu permease|nr:hypothetical protein [Pseudolabrys sp.]